MTVGMERYKELLHEFQGISQAYIDHETLETLKEEYKDTIYSRRVLETIVDVNGLLKVLEKRRVLQYDEISVLRHIAEKFVQDKSITDLISNYEQWFSEHSSDVNNLYSCGKSSNLLNKSKLNIPNISKTDNLRKIESNSSSEESLLLEEIRVNNTHSLQRIEKRNIFSSIFIQKCSRKCKQKSYIFVIVIILLLLILTISVIGIFVKISYQSTAIVPEAEPVTNTSVNQFESKMPYFMSNVNLGFSTESRFSMNAQSSATTTPMPAVDREKELQDLVINKVSRKIGKFWADVCRRLKMEESDIDRIENRHMRETPYNHEKMFKEALNLYFSEPRPSWKMDLMRALESSRRKDLKEMVEEILNQHNYF